MNDVAFRFQGRFLYAEQKVGGESKLFSVIAPRFEKYECEHQPLMSIRHGSVVFKNGGTDLPPAFRILSDDTGPDPQIVVWDLTGLRMTYPVEGTPKVELTGKAEVADLGELEDNEGRRAQFNPGGWANALIEVAAPGMASQPDPKNPITFNYSVETLARKNTPEKRKKKGTAQDLAKEPADRTTFTIPNTSSELTLSFLGPNGKVGTVMVKGGATVCFSNACAKIEEPPPIDLEFSRYYDLLLRHDKDALIPFTDSLTKFKLVEGIPCYQQARIVV